MINLIIFLNYGLNNASSTIILKYELYFIWIKKTAKMIGVLLKFDLGKVFLSCCIFGLNDEERLESG